MQVQCEPQRAAYHRRRAQSILGSYLNTKAHLTKIVNWRSKLHDVNYIGITTLEENNQ
jgi:hypothetical protein